MYKEATIAPGLTYYGTSGQTFAYMAYHTRSRVLNNSVYHPANEYSDPQARSA
jgi:hypothetical protein